MHSMQKKKKGGGGDVRAAKRFKGIIQVQYFVIVLLEKGSESEIRLIHFCHITI